jgi:hypothetical protein
MSSFRVHAIVVQAMVWHPFELKALEKKSNGKFCNTGARVTENIKKVQTKLPAM